MWSILINWRGTTYRLHPLLVLLMVASLLTGYFVELATLFGIVLIHELGHVAAARGFGWRVREVQLLPFGGVASVEESSNVPAREELIVALAGPLQNAWMAAFAALMRQSGWGDLEWWDYFVQANLMIGLFNLIPVLPLDGGKLMQALFSYGMTYHRAMLSSVWISLFVSLMVVLGSLVQLRQSGIQLNLLVIGLFLFYSNWYGYKHLPFQFLRFLMSREKRAEARVLQGALAQPIVVGGRHKLAVILRMFMREKYHLIYVMDAGGQIVRVIPEQQLVRTYFQGKNPGCAISDLFVVK